MILQSKNLAAINVCLADNGRHCYSYMGYHSRYCVNSDLRIDWHYKKALLPRSCK